MKTKRRFDNNGFNKAHYTVAAVAVKYPSLKGNTNSSSIALHTGKGSKDPLNVEKNYRSSKSHIQTKKRVVCNGDLNNVKGFVCEEVK